MSRLRGVLLVSLLAVLAGCATETEFGTVDSKKAAQLNAQLGLNYMVQGKNEMAMDKLQKAVEYDSHNIAAQHYLGELYRRLGKNDEADEHFRKAVDLAPDDSSLQNNYGVFLCGLKKYRDGEKHLLKAVDNPVYEARDEAYHNLGLCVRDAGDIAKAEEYFRDALKVNPRLPAALLELTDLMLQQKNYVSARAFLQRYSAVAPHKAHSLWLGIQIERVLGDKDALASYALSLKNNFPDSEETKLYLDSVKP